MKSKIDVEGFVIQANISAVTKSVACKGLSIQLVFTLPLEKQQSTAKVTKVEKFRKKDFQKQKDIRI